MKNISTLIIILTIFTLSSFANNSTTSYKGIVPTKVTTASPNEFKFNLTEDKKEDSNVHTIINRNDVVNRSNDNKRGSFETVPAQVLSSIEGV